MFKVSKSLNFFFFCHLDYWYQVQPVAHFCHQEKMLFVLQSLHTKVIFSYSQFEGELYLLATDQGYINQPDLVWEKLNEVKQYCFMIFFIEIIYFLSFYVATGRCSQLNILKTERLYAWFELLGYLGTSHAGSFLGLIVNYMWMNLYIVSCVVSFFIVLMADHLIQVNK